MSQSISDMEAQEPEKRGPGRPAKRGPREESRERKTASRAERVPLGVPRSKMSVPNRPGFVRRWVNDNGSRLHAAQQAGYEFVDDPSLKVGDQTQTMNSDLGGAISQVVGKREDGSSMRAYLMEIPDEFYQEDQQAKQAQVDQIDQAIKTGNIEGTVGVDGRYVPNEGIKISRDM